jgi:hypothetical protein
VFVHKHTTMFRVVYTPQVQPEPRRPISHYWEKEQERLDKAKAEGYGKVMKVYPGYAEDEYGITLQEYVQWASERNLFFVKNIETLSCYLMWYDLPDSYQEARLWIADHFGLFDNHVIHDRAELLGILNWQDMRKKSTDADV